MAVWLMLGAAAGQSALLSPEDSVRTGQDTPSPAQDKIRAIRSIHSVRGMKSSSEDTQKKTFESYARVLDADDEKNYRQLFAALKEGRLQDAETATVDIKDGVLLGAAEAAYILHPRNAQIRYEQVLGWLKNYSDLPQSGDVYKKALVLRVAGAPQPEAPPAQNSDDAELNIASAAPLEWKKPRAMAAETLWRAGKLDEALEKLKDIAPAKDAPEEAQYALWLKGLLHWAKADYPNSAESFARLADANVSPAGRAAAAFWAARAYEKMGDAAHASQFMDLAAQTPRSFYGLLALAGRANLADEQNNSASAKSAEAAPAFSKQVVETLKENPAALRALAFLQIDEKDLAEKELLHVAGSVAGSEELARALDALARRFNLGELALRLSAREAARVKNAKTAFYPALPWQPRGGFTSDPALVTAIAWNESRFNREARNASGASGIMQLMPGTAERMIVGSSDSLFDPETSVTLGDKYIQHLAAMQGINGNLLLLIAGYNCGPGKAQQLFANVPHGNDPLLFIESLPLKETHDYVQKVLMTYAVYRQRAGKPLTALAALRRGEWPSYEQVKTASR